MARTDPDAVDTHVLAIASHVTSGYVGNTMATFCMQTLGSEVSAIHTVNYSNHVGYKRFKGRKSTPEEVAELYEGLRDAGLDRFDMLLSGYCPSAAIVKEVGKIARDIKLRAATKPGSFFWILDPVMGDNGRIYVAEDTVPIYKSLLKDADLILPNQFEAELLSDVKINDLASMQHAILTLHQAYNLPHVLITSIRLPSTTNYTPLTEEEDKTNVAKLSVIGSTATSDGQPRLFRVTIPALPVFFSGTGDMFAALTVCRLRQAAKQAGVLNEPSWRSPDHVAGPDLPLAKATEKVLASMHAVLKDTSEHYSEVMKQLDDGKVPKMNNNVSGGIQHDIETEQHLRLTSAAEVRVVQNAMSLREPPNVMGFQAQPIVLSSL